MYVPFCVLFLLLCMFRSVYYSYCYVCSVLCIILIVMYVPFCVLFLLLCILHSVYSVSFCCSAYCLCVNVYCTTATGMSGHISSSLTEVFPCFFFSCKANARV
jgi:hypothetical protein